jgi:hypothetical protein
VATIDELFAVARKRLAEQRTKRPGLYVERRYFGYNYAQAAAYAREKTAEYGRLVRVVEIVHTAASAVWKATS